MNSFVRDQLALVASPKAFLYDRPEEDAGPQSDEVLSGWALRITEEERDGWAGVFTHYGYRGWIRTGHLIPADGEQLKERSRQGLLRVSAPWMDIYSEPDVKGRLLTCLPRGSFVLPAPAELREKTLPNKDLLFYPYSSQENCSLNVFDFINQKKGGETDESAPVEKANVPQQKNKRNQNQKQHNRYNQNQKYKNQNSKNIYQVNQRFNMTQSIQPESNWILVKDFNKRILEKLAIDFNKIKVTNKEVCGNIYPINESFEEEISPYNPKPITKI